MARYTWIVTKDLLAGDASDVVGQIGVSGVQYPFDRVIRGGDQFRLLDAKGTIVYSGFVLGEVTGAEPLEEFGRARGCTTIEYAVNGRWRSEPGVRRDSRLLMDL